MSANIAPTGCRWDCRETWACEYGASLPGGPFPGTQGSTGDVRRCKHGNVWLYAGPSSSWRFDIWRRLTWWGTPVQYHHALKALATNEGD